MLTLLGNNTNDILYNQYDSNGVEIDEIIVRTLIDKSHDFDMLTPFIMYPICIAIAAAFLKLCYSTLIKKLSDH